MEEGDGQADEQEPTDQMCIVQTAMGDKETIAYGDFPLPPQWNKDDWEATYKAQMKAAYKQESKHPDSRPIYMLGSTIGVTGNAYKFNETEYLPRLNCRSRTGDGADILASEATRVLAEAAERLTLQWARGHDEDLHALLLEAKELIPPELRIAGTFWTAETLVGDLEDGCNHLHVDGSDIVSLIIQVGTQVQGGDTVYYGGVLRTRGRLCRW